MDKVTITVNGKPVEQYIKKERDEEVSRFVSFEFRSASRWGRGRGPMVLDRPVRTGKGVEAK